MTSSTSTGNDHEEPHNPQSSVRLYHNRASYHLLAALEIFRQTLVPHVAFLHPGDRETDNVRGKRREETIMNLPLILVTMLEGDDEMDESSYVVYFHTYVHSARGRVARLRDCETDQLDIDIRDWSKR